MSEINVVSTTQRIIVDPFSSAVAVINAGPQGPGGPPGQVGPPGPGTPNEYVKADGSIPVTGPLTVPNATAGGHALNRTTGDARYLPIAAPLAKGQVAYAQILANVAIPTAVGDIAGLSITYTCEANRRYRVRAKVNAQSTVAADYCRFSLVADGGQVDLGHVYCPVANQVASQMYIEKVYSAGISAASHTFKVQAYRIGGTGTCTTVAQAGIPLFIELVDEGPV